MSFDISVVIPVHNPRRDYLARVLDALRSQTLELSRWELLLVDNASNEPLRGLYDLSWHSNAAHVHENSVGLVLARITGMNRSSGRIIVFVDDDNVLDANYLEQVLSIASKFPFIGTWSGRVELELENPQNPPPHQLQYLLCEREVARVVWSNDPTHVVATPWGAGMCVRREVALAYAAKVSEEPRRQRLDLQGKRLVFGGDTDIAYFGCAMGLGMGIFPELKIVHLIPERRCAIGYLLENLEAHAYSEILHHWVLTGLMADARSDLRGRLAYFARWLTARSMDRKIMAARARGYARARRELAIEKCS